MHPSDLDADMDRIDDEIETRIARIKSATRMESDPARRALLDASLDESVAVELVFAGKLTQRQIDDFLALGGQIDYVYRAVSYGWNGTVPLRVVEKLPGRMGAALVAIVAARPAMLTLDEATRCGRIRPAWAAGYTGDSSTTIAILDTGVDGHHTDLSGRQAYWRDWTSDNEPQPRDIIQHGTHVTGIALGTGAAAGASTGTLYYTDSGDMSSLRGGYFYMSPIHILTSSSVAFSSTATWTGGRTTDLYQIYSANGASSPYAISASTTGSSPITETNTFAPVTDTSYGAALLQNNSKSVRQYAIANSVTNYPGVDSYGKLSGAAPGCRWAGEKVFKNDGTGSSLDIKAAVDDVVAQRTARNIKVVNMSLGITTANGTPTTDSTLRQKVNNLVSNGIVAVVSAGNDGPGTASANQVADPGRAALAITVGASNDVNQLTSYTSSGFPAPGLDEDYKPDVIAPGGSDYYSMILSTDSNDADAESTSFADVQANDYCNMQGTSMASPLVAGAAALVIQALEAGGLAWSYNSSAHPLLVKMLLCMTATESNSNREASSGTNPALGRGASPKDLYEGYGLINPDAAVEAVASPFACGTISGSTGGGVHDRRAWARRISLAAGTRVFLTLTVPSSGDLDLYLYSGTPDSSGNPVIRAYSTAAGNGIGESISFASSTSETGYIVIKRASGSGAWSLTGYVDGASPLAGTALSAQYSSTNPVTVTYSGAADPGCSGLKTVQLWFKRGAGGDWGPSGLYQTASSGSFSPELTGDDVYYFGLRAEDNAGNLSAIPSGSGDTSTIFDATPPEAVTGLTTISPSEANESDWYSHSGNLTWGWTAATDATSGVDGYGVVQDMSSGTQPFATKTHDATVTSYTLAGPQSTGEYYLHIRSKDNAGNWDAAADSVQRRIRVDNTPPSEAILTLTTETESSITVTGAGVDADSGVGATSGYNYAMTGQPESGYTGTTHTWSGLLANTRYDGFRVTVRDQALPAGNTTDTSAEQSRYTLARVPAYGPAGDVTIQCDHGPTDPNVPEGQGIIFTYNSTFGDGPANVGKFGHIWDQDPGEPADWAGEVFWTSGSTLTVPAGNAGQSHFLHIRSYNNDADPAANPTVLTLGPYTAVSSCTRALVDEHPTNQAACETNKATFAVGLSGTLPFLYQWQKSTDGGVSYEPVTDGTGYDTATYTTPPTLSSMSGHMYRCYVTNCGGAYSATSDPATLVVGQTATKTVGEAKLLPDGSCVRLESSAVTGVFPGFFYVEHPNRSAGIQIRPPVPPPGIEVRPGDLINVSGTIRTRDGERCVESVEVSAAGSADPRPLGMNNRRLGGADFHYDPATGAGQRGVREAQELNNIGLLVQTWGKVTFAEGGEFYIDDGSALQDGSGRPGVRVSAEGLTVPEVGSIVRVTGISSCFASGQDLQRLIRARSAADIELLYGEAAQAGSSWFAVSLTEHLPIWWW